MRSIRTFHSLLLVLLVLPTALGARWYWGNRGWGAGFVPSPDCLEYAAGAQALANSGGYFLRVGPYRVPPRYPPGWPLCLSLAVRCGLKGESLWRVTGIVAAALSSFLALCIYGASLYVLGARHSKRVAWCSFTGALFGWLTWALAPLPIFLGQTLQSDEPCLLAGGVAIAALIVGLYGGKVPGRRVLLSLGGASLAAAAAMRTIAGGLLLPAVIVLLAGYVRLRAQDARLLGIAYALAGAGIVIGGVTACTGLMPWEWSAYAFWIPIWYGDIARTFNLTYALHGNAEFFQPVGVPPFSHLGFACQVLLGLPGRWSIAYVGRIWPIAGWVALLAALIPKPGADARRRTMQVVALAFVLVAAAHAAVYSFYFYPASRFFTLPLAICVLALSVAVACLLAETRWPLKALGVATAGLSLVSTALLARQIPSPPPGFPPASEVRAGYAAWAALDDRARAGRVVPFDPVHAQALGLLDPTTMDRIGVWGTLPLTGQIGHLIVNGTIPRAAVSTPVHRPTPARDTEDDGP